MLMYNWAFEQEGRRAGFKEQDNLVPWHLQTKFSEIALAIVGSANASALNCATLNPE